MEQTYDLDLILLEYMKDSLQTQQGLWLNSLHEIGRLLTQSKNPDVLRRNVERLQHLKNTWRTLTSDLEAQLPDYKHVVEELVKRKALSHGDALYSQLLEDYHLPSSRETQDEYNDIVDGGIAQWTGTPKEQSMGKFNNKYKVQLCLIWVANDLYQALRHQREHSTEEVPQTWNATVTKLRDVCGEQTYEICSEEVAIWMIECQFAWASQLY